MQGILQYFCKKGLSFQKIYSNMTNVLSQSIPSYQLIKNWSQVFKFESCSCSSIRCRSTENSQVQIKDLVQDIGTQWMISGFIKFCITDCILKNARLDDKNLIIIDTNPEKCLQRFVKVEKTWIYYFSTEYERIKVSEFTGGLNSNNTSKLTSTYINLFNR